VSRIPAVGRAAWCALSFLFASAVAGAETHEVGSHGAAFTSDRWERARLSPDAGKDQFRLVGADAYLMVMELPVLLEERAEFVAQLAVFVGNIEARAQQVELDPEVGYQRYDGLTRATRWLDAELSGRRCRLPPAVVDHRLRKAAAE
jgi:hypothetical protein